MKRIFERDLVQPALEVIREFGHPEQGLSISDLAPRLRDKLTPSEGDLIILRNRNDDRLSQIIRNLVSHRKLEREGLAVYYRSGRGAGLYILTDQGRSKAASGHEQNEFQN
jgi:hypothetical protein